MKTAVKTRSADAHDQMMGDYAAGRRGGPPQSRNPGECIATWLCLFTFSARSLIIHEFLTPLAAPYYYS